MPAKSERVVLTQVGQSSGKEAPERVSRVEMSLPLFMVQLSANTTRMRRYFRARTCVCSTMLGSPPHHAVHTAVHSSSGQTKT